jgi:hypothetical protein
MDTPSHTFLRYRNFRYLKLAAWLLAAATVAYLLVPPAGGVRHGGTWLGYLLGILAALMALALTWYGVARRRPTAAPLRGWLSAHVYLGGALLVLVSLHTGFRFGLNVHTLAYVLMLLVIGTGIYGVHAYMHYPARITRNMGDDRLDDVLLKIAELDELACQRALGLPDDVNGLVLEARRNTRLGGNLVQQWIGHQPDCPTAHAVSQIRALAKKYVHDDQPRLMRDLYSVLLQKEKLVAKARNEIMLKARLGGWLYVHAPFSVAFLAALLAHVAAILVHW